MIDQSVHVLCANQWSITDEKTGVLIEGTKIMYTDGSRDDKPTKRGTRVHQVSGPKEMFNDFDNLPGDYTVSFSLNGKYIRPEKARPIRKATEDDAPTNGRLSKVTSAAGVAFVLFVGMLAGDTHAAVIDGVTVPDEVTFEFPGTSFEPVTFSEPSEFAGNISYDTTTYGFGQLLVEVSRGEADRASVGFASQDFSSIIEADANFTATTDVSFGDLVYTVTSSSGGFTFGTVTSFDGPPVVPEPTSGLAATGLIGFLSLRRRRPMSTCWVRSSGSAF